MIFPGMDPYLEDPQIWPGVHAALIVYIRDQLQPLLRPRYIAAIEERVFVEGPDRQIIPDVWITRRAVQRPDSAVAVTAAAVAEADQPVIVQVPNVEVHETFIEIVDRQTGQQIVTVIEVVSPANKYPGPGRESYIAKQREVFGSQAHFVEIDLLRAGNHVLAVPEWVARGGNAYDYLICINRAQGQRDVFDLYPRSVRDNLPRIRIPLAGNDPDVPLDLQAAMSQVYEAGSYRDRINYEAGCRPPLNAGDLAWVDDQLRCELKTDTP